MLLAAMARLSVLAALFLFVVLVECEKFEKRDSAAPDFAKQEQSDSPSPGEHDAPPITRNSEKKKTVQPGRLYRVLTAEEGGWRKSDVTALKAGAEVYCHRNVSLCSSGEGVDWLSPEKTMGCKIQESDNSLMQVKCNGQEASQLISAECCEPAGFLDDTPVYATPEGLIHYATWGGTEPRNIAKGMMMVEQTYGNELISRYGNEPVLFLHFADWEYDEKKDNYSIDNNVPARVHGSPRYKPPYYRSMLKQDYIEVTKQWKLIKRIKALGMDVMGGPFPRTYLSILEALTEVEDRTAQFFIRSLYDNYGTGIHVDSRDILAALWERRAKVAGSQVVIQEVITDLSHIRGQAFDIMFYILIHAGRVYMHQNAQVVLVPRQVFFNGTKQKEPVIEQECAHSFLSSKSAGKEKQWQEAIFAQLVAALPVLEPVIRVTAEDAEGKLYHLFSVTGMIRENGEALIRNFNEWPVVDWKETGYDRASCAWLGELSVDERKRAYEDTLSTMFGDFFAIVMGLGNTTAFTDDSECSCALLDGRVREAIGFQSPSNIPQSF
jgi:hypothetical protein